MSLEAQQNTDRIIQNLVRFQRATSLHKTFISLIANILQLKREDSDLREVFLRLDEDNKGYIVARDLKKEFIDLGGVDPEDLVREADMDGDQRLDYFEFYTATFDPDLNDMYLDYIFDLFEPSELDEIKAENFCKKLPPRCPRKIEANQDKYSVCSKPSKDFTQL